MPQSDNIYYYVAYGVVLVVFFIVLKSPKKIKTTSNTFLIQILYTSI
jgi:hypothetical protein